jgi:hypothetical protein
VSANGFIVNVQNSNGADAGSGVYFSPFSNYVIGLSSLSAGATSYGVVPGTGSCTVSNMNVSVLVQGSPAAVLGTSVMTLYKGSAGAVPTASAITCSLGSIGSTAGTTATCQDHTHTVSVSGGDTLSLHFTESNGAAASAAGLIVTFTCQ